MKFVDGDTLAAVVIARMYTLNMMLDTHLQRNDTTVYD